LTPLGQGSGVVLLENIAAVEAAILIEVIVDRGVNGGELLQGLNAPDIYHSPFVSPERLV
jgi:hypothetical protein